MNKPTIVAMCIALISMTLFSVSFENMKFSQEVDTNSLQSTIGVFDSSTNSTLIIKPRELDISTANSNVKDNVNGITFEIVDDGFVKFYFNKDEFLLNDVNPIEKILVNDVSLGDFIKDVVQARIIQIAGEIVTPQFVSNSIHQMTYNPLWGKKLTVIGDSLTVSPTKDTSWGAFIAQRNNMVFVNNGRSGERLCDDRTNELGQVTNPSTISTYLRDIPSDSDFILCQIGTNDNGNWWVSKQGEDTEISTNTFKGCWNSLLIGLCTNFPNAKIGIILPHNWKYNLGTKTEDTINENRLREMSQWQKIQCQKLNIPVFDPVEDTRMFLYNHTVYPTNGVNITESEIKDSALSWYDKIKRQIGTQYLEYSSRYGTWYSETKYLKDGGHTTAQGSLFLSFYYEQWMRTVLMCE